MRFAFETLYGLNSLVGDGRDEQDVIEAILSLTDWWGPDGEISKFGSWFLVDVDGLIYVTESGVDYLDSL